MDYRKLLNGGIYKQKVKIFIHIENRINIMKITLGELKNLIREAVSSADKDFDPLRWMRKDRSRRSSVKPLPKHMTREYNKAKAMLGAASETMSLEELLRALETDENPIGRDISDPRYAQIELAWLESERDKA